MFISSSSTGHTSLMFSLPSNPAQKSPLQPSLVNFVDRWACTTVVVCFASWHRTIALVTVELHHNWVAHAFQLNLFVCRFQFALQLADRVAHRVDVVFELVFDSTF